jgi:S1-C subfamily serine protease
MKRRVALFGLAALAAAAGAGADEAALKAAARATLDKNAAAVITVRLTLKTRVVFQGREANTSESTMEIAGTLISAAGLTVVSDVTSNPSGLFPRRPDGPKVETETTDVKLVLRDGKELPARFVLRDTDLDLAFLLPDEKGLSLPFVGFEKGPVPEPLDDLVFLYAMGKTLNREVAVMVAKVRAVVRKPRTFIVADFMTGLQALGCPVFNEGGRAVGLVVVRRAAVTPTPGGSLRDMLDVMAPVVLTADDVQRVAAQTASLPPQPSGAK